MKYNLHKKFKRIPLIIILCTLLISSLFSSCLKGSGPDVSSNPSSIVSALSVINASPDSPTLEFVLDNKRVQKFAYPDTKIKYFPVFLGYHLARIYEADKLYSPLYELELNLFQGKFYSVYIAGKKDTLTSLTVEDDINIPSSGNAKIRFINLSPDASALNFYIKPDSVLASNKKFKEYTSFQEVKAGNYNASIKSYEGNSIDLPIDLKIENGKIYTIWAKGLMETTVEEETFGYSVVVHNLD